MPWALLLFLTLVNLLNFFDRYIVHSVEPLLRQEFNLLNSESGALGAAFVLGYFLFSPLFGYFGDRKDRRILMGLGLFVWSISTALTGFAVGFKSFIAARALVGIGEASFGAIVPGYLKGRINDTIKLNNALSIFYIAIPCGSALGFIAGGEIAETWGWRTVFLLAAIPGVILSLGFFKLQPEKKTSAEQRGSQQGVISGVKSICARPDLCLTILGYVLNTFALNGVAMFVVRHGTSLGIDESTAAAYFGGVLALTGFVGSLGGGYLASLCASRMTHQIYGLLLFVSMSTLLGTPFLGAAFLAPSWPLFLFFCFIAQLALFAGVAPLNSVIVERAPRGLEALTQGVTIFMIQLFGSALGPVVIGWVADRLQGGICAGSPEKALAYGLQVATCAMLTSGVLWWFAAKRSLREST